jgi:hypothetical protein
MNMSQIIPNNAGPKLGAQYYVFNAADAAGKSHVGPVSADLIARGVVAGKLPEDALVAPVGDSRWAPLSTFADLTDALRNARTRDSSMRPIPMPSSSKMPLPPALAPLPPSAPIPRELSPVAASLPAPQPMNVVALAFTPPSAPPPSSSMPSAAPPMAPSPMAPSPMAPSPMPPPAMVLPTQASPLMLAPSPAPALSATAPAPQKPEQKKPILDPRFKLLPLAIFAGFGVIGLLETAIVLIVR